MPRSKLATVAGFLGALGLFDVVMGPLLIHLGIVEPMMGFQFFFALGLLSGVVAFVLGLIALWRTREGSGKGGRPMAWLGTGIGLVLVCLAFVSAGPGSGLPPINDITTNLEDPPAFPNDPSDRGRDMAYPAEFVPQVKSAYPDLATILVAAPPAEATARAAATARELGWTVDLEDPTQGLVVARQATRVFQFVDDVVIRVRPHAGGTAIDLRSKSRDGRGDLGANAARIRAFSEALPR